MAMAIPYLLLLVEVLAFNSLAAETLHWNLPLMPKSIPPYPNYTAAEIANNANYTHKIPRLIWIQYRNVPVKLKSHVTETMTKNPLWKVHNWGHAETVDFMETYFANTSVLWAIKAANPAIGVSHADIWRYCVLWAFGGFYSDDDSFIGTPLSTIVQQNDSMILTPEKGAYIECYHPSYELSRESQNRTNVNQIQLSSSYDRPIVNWAIFSEPGSLVLENALRNIVDIFKYEYFRRSVIHIKHNQMRAYNVFCSTGPVFFVSSLRQFAIQNPDSPYLPRITLKIEFSEYRAIGKVRDDCVQGSDHYSNKIARLKLPLLHSYYPLSVSLFYLEGRFIISTPFPIISNTSNDSATRNLDPKSDITIDQSAHKKSARESISNEKSLESHSRQSLRHLKHADITEIRNGNTNISSIPVIVNITTEFPDRVQGLGYYRVTDGVLIVYPDFCSFLVASTDNGQHTTELTVVSTNALHDLFQYYPDIMNTTQSDGIGSKFLNSSTLNPRINIAPHTTMTTVITSDSKEYFLLKNCVRYSFPDADTFTSMGFSFKNAIGLRKKLMMMIPYGGTLDKIVGE